MITSPIFSLKTLSNGFKFASIKTTSKLSFVGAILPIGIKDGSDVANSLMTQFSHLSISHSLLGTSPYFCLSPDRSLIFFEFLKPQSHSNILQSFFTSPTDPFSCLPQFNTSNIFKSEKLAFSSSFPHLPFSDFYFSNNKKTINKPIIPFDTIIFSSDDQKIDFNFKPSLNVNLKKFELFSPTETTFTQKSNSLNQICFSFEAGGYHHVNHTALIVLQRMFGHGSIFSSEGFGSGNSGILFKKVIMTIPGINSAGCFYHPVKDTGLISFYFDYFELGEQQIRETFRKLFEIPSDIKREIERAKEAAILQYLIEHDSSTSFLVGVAEDLFNFSELRDQSSVVNSIRKVSVDDIVQIFSKLKSAPFSCGLLKRNLT